MTKTVKAQVVTYEYDTGGYLIYIFRLLDEEDITLLQSNYWMCVQFPNWEHRILEIGEIGFLVYKEIIEGVDKYYDGNNILTYRYSNIQFIRFIKEKQDIDLSNL